MIIDKSQLAKINTALDRLAESNAISGVPRNMQILRFLADCYVKDISVKEATIALELAEGRDQDLLDGKIRGYMFTLRKKMEEYYNGEGKDDELKFTIKKGQYNLSVKEDNTHTISNSNKNAKYWVAIIGVLLILFASIFLLPKTSLYCWDSFLDKSSTNICCVGDHFIVEGEILNGQKTSFYSNLINSEEDITRFYKDNSDFNSELEKADYSFITKMGAIGTANLAYWFALHKADYKVMMESEVSLDMIKENNIIYIGPYKNMKNLDNLFLSSSERFACTNNILSYKATGEVIPNYPNQKIREEHVIVSYNRLTDSGKNIIYIAANNDYGVLQMLKNFTDTDWLKNFYTNLPHQNSYFNALFKVKGIKRTDIGSELIEVEVLE